MKEDKSGKRVMYEDKDYTHLPIGQVLQEMKESNDKREQDTVNNNAKVRQS